MSSHKMLDVQVLFLEIKHSTFFIFSTLNTPEYEQKDLQRCQCTATFRMSSGTPVGCLACPPQSGTPLCGSGFCPWFLRPINTTKPISLRNAEQQT